MTVLSRRATLTGIAAAFAATPLRQALAALNVVSPPSLDELARATVGRMGKRHVEAALDGVFSKIFQVRKSTMAIETIEKVSLTYPGLPESVRVVEPREDIAGQRFRWNFEPYEVGMGFRVVADDDPRAVAPTASIIQGLARLKQRSVIEPVRASDMPEAFELLFAAFREERETAAARIFNCAETYDPCVGGDGCSLVSERHPHDGGTWSNVFYLGEHAGVVHMDLNRSSLAAALKRIETSFVAENGTAVAAKGKLLVVPSSLEDIAAALDFPYVVWSHLEDRHSWFVVTDVPGLVWFQRCPFEMVGDEDHETKTLIVKGYERYKFGCHDPRAVFGSLPEA